MIPGYDLHSKTFTNKSSSFRIATLREIVSVPSSFVSMLPAKVGVYQVSVAHKIWNLFGIDFDAKLN